MAFLHGAKVLLPSTRQAQDAYISGAYPNTIRMGVIKRLMGIEGIERSMLRSCRVALKWISCGTPAASVTYWMQFHTWLCFS